jgi:hypothetical protein
MTLLAASHPFEDLAAWEWVLVGISVLAAVWVIWKAVLLTIRPGETDPNHIKRQILEDPAPADPAALRPDPAALHPDPPLPPTPPKAR